MHWEQWKDSAKYTEKMRENRTDKWARTKYCRWRMERGRRKWRCRNRNNCRHKGNEPKGVWRWRKTWEKEKKLCDWGLWEERLTGKHSAFASLLVKMKENICSFFCELYDWERLIQNRSTQKVLNHTIRYKISTYWLFVNPYALECSQSVSTPENIYNKDCYN